MAAINAPLPSLRSRTIEKPLDSRRVFGSIVLYLKEKSSRRVESHTALCICDASSLLTNLGGPKRKANLTPLNLSEFANMPYSY